jgi:hypothetical protein
MSDLTLVLKLGGVVVQFTNGSMEGFPKRVMTMDDHWLVIHHDPDDNLRVSDDVESAAPVPRVLIPREQIYKAELHPEGGGEGAGEE